MLNSIERWIVFAILCIVTLGAFVLEGFIIYSFLTKDISWLQGTLTALNSGIFYAVARQFIAIIRSTFLQRGVAPLDRLHRYSSERTRIIDNAARGRHDAYLTRQLLVTNTLKFAEESFRNWLRGTHFEVSVFVDREQPLLFAYFDSNQDTKARTMGERERDPFYYIKRGYEVTKLLEQPTSQPRVVPYTEDKKAGYVFASEQQRSQIQSTLLLCLDVNTPCAIVFTSNAKGAFSVGNAEQISFARLILELVRFDLFEGGFVHQIRDLKPALFVRGDR